MKSRKIISIVLVIAILSLTGAPEVFAKPGRGNGQDKGGMSPGLFKNKILKSDLSEEEAVELIIENARSLSPGILKEIILGLDLSEDSLEELEEEGILDSLPGGILKEIFSEDDDEDEEDEDEEEIEVKGTITGIDVEDKVIEIDDEEYQLPEEVEVEIDGEEAKLSDLEIGMKVELEIEDEEAEIEAESIEDEEIEVEGTIKDLDLVGIYHITIDKAEYELSRDAQVVINGLRSTLEDLEIGMNVTVEIQEEIVVKVNVEFEIEEIEGTITGIDLEDRYIVIDEVEYKLAKEVEIRLNNEEATLEDLKVEMEINAIELNGEIVEINAYKQENLEVQGRISSINLEKEYIAIGGVYYKLTDDTTVKVDGETATLEDLIVGMSAEAELIDGKIVKIYTEIIETSKVEGNITDLDLIGIYHLSVDNQEYDLLREAIVTLNGKDAKLEDLKLGMSAMIYLVGNDIIKIEATIVNKETVLGEIKDIDLIGEYHLTVGDKEYVLSKEAQVTIDGEEAELADLKVEMDVEIEIDNGLVEVIKADSIEQIEVLEVQGVLTAINLTERTITIDEEQYDLADNMEVVIVNGEKSSLEDIVVNMNVEVELQNNVVIKIAAEEK